MENENKNALTNYENFNINNEEILSLQIRRRPIETKKNGKQFVFDVLMNISVYKDVEDAETGLITKEFQGELNRWVGLHFRKDAFDNIPQECKIHKLDDLSTGTLFVRADNVKPPKEYYPHYEDKEQDEWDDDEQTKYDEDGTIPQVYVRPSCWIHKDAIVGFIPYRPSQDRFTYKPRNTTNDVDSSSLEVTNDIDSSIEKETKRKSKEFKVDDEDLPF